MQLRGMIRNCSTLDVRTLKGRVRVNLVRHRPLGPVSTRVVDVFRAIVLPVHAVWTVLDAAVLVDVRFTVSVFVDFLDGIVPVMVKVG